MSGAGLRLRLAQLTEQVEAWKARAAHRPQTLYLSDRHVEVFTETLAERIGDAHAHGRRDLDAPEARAAFVKAITDAELIWQLLRYVVDQRLDPARGPMLQLADLCAADGYAAVRRALPVASRAQLSVPPLVVIEAGLSPMTYPRGLRGELPRLVARHHLDADPDVRLVRVPLVLFPPDQLAKPWALGALQHEVGHDLSHALGLQPLAKEALAAAFPGEVRWVGWAEELLADLFGVLLGGTAFVAALAGVLWELASLLGRTSAYPEPALRMQIVAAISRELGDAPERVVRALGPFGQPAPPPDAERAARALLSIAIPDGPALRDVVADRAASERATQGGDGACEVPWRLLPAVAQWAVLDSDGSEAALQRIAEATWARAAQLPKPEWAMTDAEWAFARAALAELAPSLRVGARKASPQALLEGAERAALVGATQHRLPRALQGAFAARDGRPWRWLEVYVLTEDALDALYEGDAAHWKAQRAEVLTFLRAHLPRMAERWAVRAFEVPYCFASYWDWEARGGRIHVSMHLWGADLTITPSLDLIWSGADRPAAYAGLADGLVALRQRARLLAGDGAVPPARSETAALPVALPSPPPPPPVPPEWDRAQQRLRELLLQDPETVDDLAAWTAEVLAIEAQYPGSIEALARVPRRADRRADVAETLQERWNIRWRDVARPRTLGALGALLADAVRQGRSVRAVGAARSLSDVSNPIDLPDDRSVVPLSLLELSDALPFSGPAGSWHAPPRTARFAAGASARDPLYRCEAGRSVARVLQDLEASGRALANHGSGAFQGIVGAITTGTHGSGARFPPLSGLVRAMTVVRPHGDGFRVELIQGEGDRRAFDLADGDRLEGPDGIPITAVCSDAIFDATTIGLGCLGLVYAVTLEVIPELVFLEDSREVRPWREVSDELEALVDTYRHVEVQISPHAPDRYSHACQLVRRRETDARTPRGDKPAAILLGSSFAGAGLVGGAIRRAMQHPEQVRENAHNGLACTSSPGGPFHYRDYIARVLLLDLKYEGLGAEFAVPMARARAVAEEILAMARAHDDAVRALPPSGPGRFEALRALWQNTPPLTAVVTMRFCAADRALLAMTQGEAGTWCIFEIGMLGAPGLNDEVRAHPDPQPDEPATLTLYRDYLDGRRRFLQRLTDALTHLDIGARPHWGLFNTLDQAQAAALWPETWPVWLARYDEVNATGVFDNAYTDQLGISRRPPGLARTVVAPLGLAATATLRRPAARSPVSTDLGRALCEAFPAVEELAPDRAPMRLAAAAARPLRLADDEHAVLLAQDGDGACCWMLPERTEAGTTFPTPASIGTPVRSYLLRFFADAALPALAHTLDRLVAPGLVEWSGASGWRPLGAAAAPRKLLLLLHGTFVDTAASFSALSGSGFLQGARYDAVWGFDHHTVSEDPLASARALHQALAQATLRGAVDIDVVSHSRGGLVVASWLAQVRPGAQWQPTVRAWISIAAPYAGTALASPGNWTVLADAVTTAALSSGPLPGAVIGGVSALVKAAALALDAADPTAYAPGVAAMIPGAPFLAALARAVRDAPDWPQRWVIGADFAPRSAALRTIHAAARATLGGQEHDLVVPVPSMRALQRGVSREEVLPDGPVHHLAYFGDDRVQTVLREWSR